MSYFSESRIQNILNKIIKTNFKVFLQKSFYTLHPNTPFINNWHIDLICEYLKALENREIKRLIINIPPRYLKSFCISVAWSAWLLAQDSTRKIIVASHSMQLAKKLSLDCKALVNANWYKNIFDTTISNKQNTKEKFCTTDHGFRIACSIGSNITGEGGDFLIVDDPLTPSQAFSEKKLARVNEWFASTFLTRLNDKKNGVVVVVMQRLNSNDLSGCLLKNKNWEYLKLPIISEDKEDISFKKFSYSRYKDELLCEKREGFKEVCILKKELGLHAFSAQYQQNPISMQSKLIDKVWIQRYSNVPNFNCVYQSWDTAIKIGIANDYSVCTSWGLTNNAYYLIDVFKKKLGYPDLKQMIVEKYNEYKPNGVIIEDKASGQQIIQDINSISKMPIIKFLPKKSKLVRFMLALNIIEAGKLYLPKGSSWLYDFEAELLSFPESNHDDQVDSMVQFFTWYKSRNNLSFNIRKL
jgi:predicted phage terminase large subunit-like protein